jgi:hypothetical protein
MAEKPTPRRRSGATPSYAERVAAGKPSVTYVLSRETVDMIERLSDYHHLPKSKIVELAVRELDQRRSVGGGDPEP